MTSAPDTTAVATAQDAVSRFPRDRVARAVGAGVARLQGDLLCDDDGRAAPARAALARLRRAVTAAPGAAPAVWELTLGLLPADLLGTADEPTPAETATHVAVTLYAVHQQSRTERMHRPGVRFGAAARRLAYLESQHTGTDVSEGVMRLVHALTTATDTAEAVHHLRALVSRMRSADVGLDYGRLARDLHDLQRPATVDRVRLQWGRDFHRRPTQPATAAAATPDAGPSGPGEVPLPD